MRIPTVLAGAAFMPLVLVAACTPDSTSPDAGTRSTPDSTFQDAGTRSTPDSTLPDTGARSAARSHVICPGPDAERLALAAFFAAREGDTIEFCAGHFDFTKGLVLHDARGVTIRGAGRNETVLSFADSEVSEVFTVHRTEGVTVQGLTIEDPLSVGLWVAESKRITLRDVRVRWSDYATCDPDPAVATGCVAHGTGIIVATSRDVLVENAEVLGAALFGLGVGTSADVVVRGSRAERNVLGFLLLNNYRALFEHNFASGNTVGLGVAAVPSLSRHGMKTILRHNAFLANNGPNFAPLGADAGNAAPGTGMSILAADQVEVYGNTIADNDSMGLIVINTAVPAPAENDAKLDFYPEGLDIHDNVFRDNGGNPAKPNPRRGPGSISTSAIVAKNGGKSAHIVWDGGVDRPNGCASVPVDQDGVPLTQPNPANAREEPRTDERGRPNFQGNDPDPSCKWNVWKFDAAGELAPANRIYIADNRFESTRPATMRVDPFVNLHQPTTARPQQAFDLLVPVSNDLGPHAGRLPALAFRALDLPYRVRPAPGPTAAETRAACSAARAGEINWRAVERHTCPRLSDYGLFADSAEPRRNPNGGGVPYDLTTPLFSDYAVKYRVLWLPPGETAHWTDYAGDPQTANDDSFARTLEFPVGTVIAKTFAFRKELADGALISENIVETRLLIKREEAGKPRWVGMAYVWRDTPTGRVAELSLEGATASVEFDYFDKDPDVRDASGARQRYTGATDRYEIPAAITCANCHGGTERDAGAAPLSLKPRHLNRDNFCPNGTRMNQLDCLRALGLLSGMPGDSGAAERAPRWNVPGDGGAPAHSAHDVSQRMRAYLEINCAHCHTRDARAEATGLWLDSFRPIDKRFGICRSPLQKGRFNGRVWDIVVGDADASVLHFRDTSNAEHVRMPQLARSLVNEEASALMIDWIDRALPTLDAEDEDAVRNETACP